MKRVKLTIDVKPEVAQALKEWAVTMNVDELGIVVENALEIFADISKIHSKLKGMWE